MFSFRSLPRLRAYAAFGDDDTEVYCENDIRVAATEIVGIPDSSNATEGLLAVYVDGINVSFALFQWHGAISNATRDENRYRMLFQGDGTGGSLREMRHAYWGEADNAGYIFYTPRKLICEALTALGKWFD